MTAVAPPWWWPSDAPWKPKPPPKPKAEPVKPYCQWCGNTLTGQQRRYCHPDIAPCRQLSIAANPGTHWRTVAATSTSTRPRTADYRALLEVTRTRAAGGEACHFHGVPGYEQCPGAIDTGLPPGHQWGYTMHHLRHIMWGGPVVPGPGDVAPAHRSCNSADGLRQQNIRRRLHMVTTTERTSRAWL